MFTSAFVLFIVFLPNKFTLGEKEVSKNAQEVSMLSNGFIAEIFQTFNEDMENLVFSPFSFASNIVMLLEGASGETAQEIHKSLGVNIDSLEGLRSGFKYFYDNFEARKEELEAAGSYNKIVVNKGIDLLSTYTNIMGTYYQANITQSPKNETGLELHSDTGILSHWRDYERLPVYVFLSHQTAAPFQLMTLKRSSSNEKEVLVPMIPQVGVFKRGHIEQLKCSAVELLFEAKTVSLLLLIPDETDGIISLVEQLSNVSIPRLLDDLIETETEISMPQMAFAIHNLDFTPILKKRGIQRALNSSVADFSRASSDESLYLKSLTQTAYFTSSFSSIKAVAEGLPKLDKSEKLIKETIKEPSRRKRDINRLSADHPFLFFVVIRETGLVLLCGKVENPTQTP